MLPFPAAELKPCQPTSPHDRRHHGPTADRARSLHRAHECFPMLGAGSTRSSLFAFTMHREEAASQPGSLGFPRPIRRHRMVCREVRTLVHASAVDSLVRVSRRGGGRPEHVVPVIAIRLYRSNKERSPSHWLSVQAPFHYNWDQEAQAGRPPRYAVQHPSPSPPDISRKGPTELNMTKRLHWTQPVHRSITRSRSLAPIAMHGKRSSHTCKLIERRLCSALPQLDLHGPLPILVTHCVSSLHRDEEYELLHGVVQPRAQSAECHR